MKITSQIASPRELEMVSNGRTDCVKETAAERLTEAKQLPCCICCIMLYMLKGGGVDLSHSSWT